MNSLQLAAVHYHVAAHDISRVVRDGPRGGTGIRKTGPVVIVQTVRVDIVATKQRGNPNN